MHLKEHVLSARFLETEEEEEVLASMFWWRQGQGQPTLHSARSPVEQRVWLRPGPAAQVPLLVALVTTLP